MTDDDILTSTGPAPARQAEDLSEEISRSVEKEPGDEVRCTRVLDDSYRCNWWSQHHDNPGTFGLFVTTHRVRKSCFLHVTRHATGLVITEAAFA
jgi:hypothetical protein